MEEATMTMDERATARAVVLGPGEGTAVWFLGNLMVVKATTESTNGAYGLLESLVAAGNSPPLHIHHGEDETFWVLEGSMTVRCGDETFSAGAGSVRLPPAWRSPHVPHRQSHAGALAHAPHARWVRGVLRRGRTAGGPAGVCHPPAPSTSRR